SAWRSAAEAAGVAVAVAGAGAGDSDESPETGTGRARRRTSEIRAPMRTSDFSRPTARDAVGERAGPRDSLPPPSMSVLAILGFALLSQAAAAATPQRPSLLLITLDTTRADYVGRVEEGKPLTPNLDA